MNHPALEEEVGPVEAVLEVTVGSGEDTKTSFLYASRINGNGSWRYIRGNGKGYKKDMDPERLSENMVRASIQRGYTEYQVHYLWSPKGGQEKEGIVKIKN